MYTEDDMLMLSGIQHYVFCPRQWAIIHIDQQWSENELTIEGQIQHQNVDDPSRRMKLNGVITLRSLNVSSKSLGLYGICDVVELHPTSDISNSMTTPRFAGNFLPYPIEYKHDKPKSDYSDIMQLTAQAICLEEIYNVKINKGALYYWKTRERCEIEITEELKQTAVNIARHMHLIYEEKSFPICSNPKICNRCSLKNICMPEALNTTTADQYLNKYLYEKTS